MIGIRKAGKDENLPDYVRWIVYDTNTNEGDACLTFRDAVQFYLWRLGVPARIVFRKGGRKEGLKKTGNDK